jgi:hypothetical protein
MLPYPTWEVGYHTLKGYPLIDGLRRLMNRSLASNPRQNWRQLADAFDLFFYLKIILALAAYYFFNDFVFGVMPLEEAGYYQSVLVVEALKRGSNLLLLLGCVLLLLFNYVKSERNPFRGRLSWQYYEAEEGIKIRYVVFLVALVLAWAFSTNEFNFYYNQGHYFDRLLLVTLAFLVLINPVFATLFVAQAVLMVSQYNYPAVLTYSWFDKKLLFKVLLLFSVFNVLSLFSKFRPTHFILLTLCLIGSDYLFAGISKLVAGNRIIDWGLKNQVHNLFVSSYINGWLTFIDRSTLLQIASVMRLLDIPLQGVTLIFELGGLLLVAGRKISIIMLAGAILLHFGIFLSSGIFFWKWILLDLSLIVVFLKYPNIVHLNLFTRRNAILSVLVIVLGHNYLSETNTGWFDTRVNNYYEFEAIDTNGTIRPIARGLWAPYDIPFAQDRFFFLSDDKVIAGTYGTHGIMGIALALNRAETVEEVEALWEEYGRSRYSESNARIFDNFVRTFIRNANDHIGNPSLPIPHAPHHITTLAQENAYNSDVPIETVRIRYVETFYDGESIIVLEDKVIREIEID